MFSQSPIFHQSKTPHRSPDTAQDFLNQKNGISQKPETESVEIISKRSLHFLLWSVIALALVGFTDSAFLLAKRMSGAPIPCFITSGCDTVSKSPYSILFGVPLSAWGVLFYLGTGFLALLYIDTKNLLVGKLIAVATTLGFFFSAYFIYVQKFKIGAFCIYCILSALVSTALFILGITIWRKLKP